jgi:hypothetical protein
MRALGSLCCFLAIFAFGCSSQQEEEGPDYDNMVMADEEEGWIADEELDRKVTAGDLPVPQEMIILETPQVPDVR